MKEEIEVRNLKFPGIPVYVRHPVKHILQFVSFSYLSTDQTVNGFKVRRQTNSWPDRQSLALLNEVLTEPAISDANNH